MLAGDHDDDASAGPWNAFRAACARIGRDASLVQGAGGNASLKRKGVLRVKASGKWLAEADQQDIFVALDLDAARARVAAGSEDYAHCLLDGATLRPSIETGMHAVLPHQVVLHLHSVNALAYATLADGEQALAQPLAGIDWTWIPYCRPGAPLTSAIASRVNLHATSAKLLILANHGLVLAADGLGAALALLDAVEQALHVPARVIDIHSQAPALAEVARRIDARLPADATVHGLALDATALGIAALGALYPDHVVFLGAVPNIRSADQMQQFCWQDGAAPYVIVRNVGVLLRADISANAQAMLSCWAALALRMDRAAALVPLSESAILELTGWDAEKYRQSLDSGKPT